MRAYEAFGLESMLRALCLGTLPSPLNLERALVAVMREHAVHRERAYRYGHPGERRGRLVTASDLAAIKTRAARLVAVYREKEARREG